MWMRCQGPGCDEVFEAKRPNAKYHHKACSVRASRQGLLGEPTPADGPPKPGRAKRKPVDVRSRLARYTERELAAVARLETSAGQAALILALRIDAGGAETGSALAAMVREHALAMERALAESHSGDPVEQLQRDVRDEVAKQRAIHSGAG